MASGSPKRSSLRLRATGGDVLLRQAGLPDVACRLVELSEHSCRCVVPLKTIPAGATKEWRQLLELGRKLTALLSVAGHVTRLPLTIEITSLRPRGADQELEMGLGFSGLDEAAQGSLRKVVVGLAAEKVRNHLSGTSALYVTGSGKAPLPPEPPAPPAGAAASSLESPSKAVSFRGQRVGDALVRMGKLNELDMEEAALAARQSGEKLGRYLVRTGRLSTADLCRALSLTSGLPMTDLNEEDIPDEAQQVFPPEQMAQYQLVPFDLTKRCVCVAVPEPLPASVVARLEEHCGKKVEVFLAEEDLVRQLLDAMKPQPLQHRRQHPRYAVVLPVEYQYCTPDGLPAERTRYTGRTVDVSQSGFLIEGPPCALGEPERLCELQLTLAVHLRVRSDTINASCQIRYVEVQEAQAPGALPWRIGAHVARMSPGDIIRLRQLCLALAQQGTPAAQ